MGDTPYNLGTPLFINSYSEYFGGDALRNVVGIANPGTTAWATTNTALYLPFQLPFAYLVRRLYWGNGGAAGGNISVGIYDHNGTGIYVSGSIAGAGNSQLQYTTPGTEFILTPNRYYFGMVMDNTTGNRLQGSSPAAANLRMCGLYQEALGGLPLPAAATFASYTQAKYPICGITRTSTGF